MKEISPSCIFGSKNLNPSILIRLKSPDKVLKLFPFTEHINNSGINMLFSSKMPTFIILFSINNNAFL